MIFIEISGQCQSKCPYCAQRRLRQAQQFGKIMPPSLFAQILEYISRLDLLNKVVNPTINLYNWGEPTLNPDLNDILQILKKNNLYADISSNFIIKPSIVDEFFPVLKTVTFSLSGFTQESYATIHGASLNKVLKHFNEFYEKASKLSPSTKIIIAWHRYIFNESEFWNAYKFFKRPGIIFKPYVAFINDLLEMLEFLEGSLSTERYRHAEKNIFSHHIRQRIAYHQEKSQNYNCPAWNDLVIDETGQLLLCCGITGYDLEHVIGNILEMSKAEIMERKSSDPLCQRCISHGLARWYYNENIGGSHDLPWPRGGNLYFLKLWILCNVYFNLPLKFNKHPYGKWSLSLLKKIRKQFMCS
jgi:pyruvate-formate lyase-activating enzyme